MAGMNKDTVRRAIALAKAGNRSLARRLFLQIVEDDPQQELAWLWLSDLLDDPDDRVAALQNALVVNPRNAAAQRRLPALRAQQRAFHQQRAARSEELFQLAQQALRAGDRQKATNLLLELVQDDQEHEQAWLLLADVVPEIQDQIIALENVLTLAPDRDQVRRRLADLQRAQQSPLLLGIKYEEQGDLDRAAAAYLTAFQQARSRSERREVDLRRKALQRRWDAPQLKVISPTLTVVRLTAGLSLVYLLLVLVHSGLNPFRSSVLSAVGVVNVISGSFFVAVTQLRPKHPLWLALFAQPRSIGESTARWVLSVSGWFLFLTSYVLLFVSAAMRLNT